MKKSKCLLKIKKQTYKFKNNIAVNELKFL